MFPTKEPSELLPDLIKERIEKFMNSLLALAQGYS